MRGLIYVVLLLAVEVDPVVSFVPQSLNIVGRRFSGSSYLSPASGYRSKILSGLAMSEIENDGEQRPKRNGGNNWASILAALIVTIASPGNQQHKQGSSSLGWRCSETTAMIGSLGGGVKPSILASVPPPEAKISDSEKDHAVIDQLAEVHITKSKVEGKKLTDLKVSDAIEGMKQLKGNIQQEPKTAIIVAVGALTVSSGFLMLSSRKSDSIAASSDQVPRSGEGDAPSNLVEQAIQVIERAEAKKDKAAALEVIAEGKTIMETLNIEPDRRMGWSTLPGRLYAIQSRTDGELPPKITLKESNRKPSAPALVEKPTAPKTVIPGISDAQSSVIKARVKSELSRTSSLIVQASKVIQEAEACSDQESALKVLARGQATFQDLGLAPDSKMSPSSLPGRLHAIQGFTGLTVEASTPPAAQPADAIAQNSKMQDPPRSGTATTKLDELVAERKRQTQSLERPKDEKVKPSAKVAKPAAETPAKEVEKVKKFLTKEAKTKTIKMPWDN